MSFECEVCGKRPQVGNQIVQRGKAKYLGGNGRKTTGITKRVFRPNLQRVRCQENEQIVNRRVCTQCIRSGKVRKPVVRKLFTLPSVN